MLSVYSSDTAVPETELEGRENDVFFPRLGFTFSEFAIWYLVNEGKSKSRTFKKKDGLRL